MTLFAIFIFGAVILGGGAMLSPAWATREPRIGFAASLSLALVMGGAVIWAMLFGWNTLVIDYLLFALVTSIFLFGTLSYGQKRAEARGEELSDADQGWTGISDLLFFAVAALVFVLPALSIPVPLDTDAQGFGYLGLMAKLGGDFRSLTPFQPEISYLYAPGFTAITAYLSDQLAMGLHRVQMAVGAVTALVNVWLAYDLGSEVRDKRLGRAMALAMLIGIGLFTAYMDSHYTTVLALVFVQGFVIAVYRYVRYGGIADAIAAGLLLGAVVLAHPDTTIILGLGYAPWLLLMWVSDQRPTPRRWLMLVVGVPAIALLALSPWLWTMRDLLGSDIVSPFERDPSHAGVMLLYHGGIILAPAIIGAIVGIRGRQSIALLAIGWLVLTLDFSTTGVLETLLPALVAPVLRYDYPFSIAWHAPIIPYSILGGIGILWLWDRAAEARYGALLKRAAPYALVAIAGIGLALYALREPVIRASKDRVAFFGAFSSAADVAAMEWLNLNTPPDARILNHPGPHEADWVPVIAERESVYFRPQPFFRGTETVEARQRALLAFWRDPAGDHTELLRAHGIDYVIVPQVMSDPASLAAMIRWRPPLDEAIGYYGGDPAESPLLQLVFDQAGARVFAVGSASPAESGASTPALAPAAPSDN